MVEWIMNVAEQPATAWWVLGLVATVAALEAIRTSKETLWGDFFAEDLDE